MSKECREPKYRQGRRDAEEICLFNASKDSPGVREGLKISVLLQVVRKWRAYRRPLRALSLPKCGTHGWEEEAGDQSSASSSKKKPTTPRGYLALYVGAERRRFLVKTGVLNHPLFGLLLDKAKEEFGFQQKGPLNIPCDTDFFKQIVLLVESSNPSLKNADAAHHPLLRDLSFAPATVTPEMRCVSPSLV